MNWHAWVTVTSNKESHVQVFHSSLSLSLLGPTLILYQLGFPKALNEKISDIALKTSLWTSYFKHLCLKITLTKELSEGQKKCFKLFVKCKKHGNSGNWLNFLGSLPHSRSVLTLCRRITHTLTGTQTAEAERGWNLRTNIFSKWQSLVSQEPKPAPKPSPVMFLADVQSGSSVKLFKVAWYVTTTDFKDQNTGVHKCCPILW